MAQIGPVLAAIEQLTASIDNRFDQIEKRLRNSTAFEDTDEVDPPQVGDQAPPLDFPRTVATVRALSGGELLERVENYYGLVHTSSLPIRVRRVHRAYGMGLLIDPQTIMTVV